MVKSSLSASIGLCINVFKLKEWWIAEPLLDVKSQWQLWVILNTKCLEVDAHVVKNSFFIREVIVVFLLAIGHEVMRSYILFLLFFFVTIVFFASWLYFSIFRSTILICSSAVSSELGFGTVVTQSGTCQLVLFWSSNQVLLTWIAFFICGLSGKLTVDVTTGSGRLWASFLVGIGSILSF